MKFSKFHPRRGEPFTAENFAEWYSCKDAGVTPGNDFADPKNWGGSETLNHGKALWYFIGVDENGRRIKGEAMMEQLPELKD